MIFFRKNQLENEILSLRVQKNELQKNQKKGNLQKENDSENYKTQNESLFQIIEDLKQKNSNINNTLKTDSDQKKQNIMKFNDLLNKYQEVSKHIILISKEFSIK